MADREILINQAGPLPISTSIQTGSNGPSMLQVSGSVWTQAADGQIGIAVLLDGTKVGEAVIWSNEPTVHRAVVPVFIEVNLDKAWPSETEMPTYTLELSPLNSATLSDYNDWFQLSFAV